MENVTLANALRRLAVVLTAGFVGGAIAMPAHAQVQTYVPLQSSAGGSFELPVSIGGESAMFLLDTGAALATISGELFDRLSAGQKISSVREVAARLADGRMRRLTVYRFSDLQLEGGCSLGSFDALVVPGKGRNLLGINVLSKFSPITLEVSPPSLGLSSCADSVAAVPARSASARTAP